MILNQILSHGSYTKDTSQLYFQHYQHMPLPCMYQYHQHTIKYQPLPCINHASTYATTCTINHIPKQVHQPCTKLASSTYVPYHVSTMHINHVHQPLTPVPYHVPTMYKTSTNMPISPSCASRTMPTSSLQHAPQSCSKPRTNLCLNK
jgi:hypothetical protein